jgi:WD40 repeat protein
MFGIVRTSVNHAKGSSKTIPKHESKTLSEHKSVVRCARFSPDGMFFATGGADTSIKLFEVPNFCHIHCTNFFSFKHRQELIVLWIFRVVSLRCQKLNR